jgi:hypothetical protein
VSRGHGSEQLNRPPAAAKQREPRRSSASRGEAAQVAGDEPRPPGPRPTSRGSMPAPPRGPRTAARCQHHGAAARVGTAARRREPAHRPAADRGMECPRNHPADPSAIASARRDRYSRSPPRQHRHARVHQLIPSGIQPRRPRAAPAPSRLRVVPGSILRRRDNLSPDRAPTPTPARLCSSTTVPATGPPPARSQPEDIAPTSPAHHRAGDMHP